MPSERPQRVRRELRSDAIAESSSPSRPSKRRRKNDDAADAAETPEAIDEGDSSHVADQSLVEDDDQLVTRVTQHLITPAVPCQASRDHSNSIHESNKEGVKAYAKISALDWTFYITRLTVNIGRQPEPAQSRADPSHEDPDAVHIDLGPSKLISRLHAVVYFNRDQEKWWLNVKGRNALKVDGAPWKAGQAGPLRSGEVIEIGGVEMMFVLPIDLSPLQIAHQYLERAGIVKPEPSAAPARPTRHPLPSGDGTLSSSPSKSSRGQSAQKPLAPAPPDYKRPGTPPPARARTASANKTPLVDHGAGPLLMSHSDVDLSLDENRHIKPQFSYAQMITQAIMNTPEQKLNLAGIYNYIQTRYAYYRHQPATGWQNSIRHNLSLNKAFEKIARSTDEPGKGMKWQLVPESREEMLRTAWRGGRGGHRGSSNPSSPSQLSYITSGPRDMAARDPISARKRKVSPSGSPQPRTSSLRDSHLTPVRPMRKPLPDEPSTVGGADDSPLPLPRAGAGARKLNAASSSSALGLVENAPGSPTLASSYLQDDGASFVTPAPLRVHPKFAPPSTAQRPSQHMPTSSPAPFWKYADIGSTPLRPVHAPFDLSPSKPLGGGGNGGAGGSAGLPPQSSSPPRRSKSPVQSPTRRAALPQLPQGKAVVEETPSPTGGEEDDGGFDLTKGFQSIGSYHAPVGHGKQVQPASNGDLSAGGGA
ncbi:fork-head transcriptional regulator 2 [Staphylotrichum tortipilum]|uniref:Fork-head transcriptional regulator 2 n=1 Tax=Staphylotrichum tortipilum TaxID=2831512 RepID=A0AAN6RPZ1_9PEZI|nr:fork-head transcriptional regulator 2 [Staphylotrichum longicolle]